MLGANRLFFKSQEAVLRANLWLKLMFKPPPHGRTVGVSSLRGQSSSSRPSFESSVQV